MSEVKHHPDCKSDGLDWLCVSECPTRSKAEKKLIADAALAQEMYGDDELEKFAEEQRTKEITVFACGGDCPKGGKHQWDGPTTRWGTGESGTCSKCGIAQIDYDMMNLP